MASQSASAEQVSHLYEQRKGRRRQWSELRGPDGFGSGLRRDTGEPAESFWLSLTTLHRNRWPHLRETPGVRLL
jgi:hypothetical protein